MLNIKKRKWGELKDLINNSKSILLTTHINADGDGLGSEIAFYYYLKTLNKECRIINSSALPYNFVIIDPDSVVEAVNDNMCAWLSNIDLTILFDIGDHRRVGDLSKYIYGKCKVVSIDHHPAKQDHPYDLNIVDSNAPATGYIIWKYFKHYKIYDTEMPIKIANALYASVVTDTGSFKYQSTTSDTHYMAANLIENGVECYDIQKYIYEQRRLSFIKLLGLVIKNLKSSKNNKIVWIVVTQKMINESGGSSEDVDGIAEFIRMIQNVEISFMILGIF